MEVIIKRMEPCLELPSLLCIATVSRFVKAMSKFHPHLVFLECVFNPPEGNHIMYHTEPEPQIYQQKVWKIMFELCHFASVKLLELEYFG